MMIIDIGQYRIDIDVCKTSRFYESAHPISLSCSCDGCRNYETAVSYLPTQITDLFTKLGIDMRKACEVYVNCKNHDGTLLYGGFYHLCGSILAGENAWVQTSPTTRHWDNNLAYEIMNYHCKKSFIILITRQKISFYLHF